MGPWWPQLSQTYGEHLTNDPVHGKQEAYFADSSADTTRPIQIELAWTVNGEVTMTLNGSINQFISKDTFRQRI